VIGNSEVSLNRAVVSRSIVKAVIFAAFVQLLSLPVTFAASSNEPDESVCFSPKGGCDVALVEFINSARKSLDIAVFDITNDSITKAIIAQSKKIEVRIVTDKREAAGRSSTVEQLVQAGVQLKIGKQKGIMHNKFTIADGVAMETGSFNYSDNATYNNNENQLYLRSPAIIAEYQNYFEQMWAVGNEFQPKGRTSSSDDQFAAPISAFPTCEKALKAGTLCIMPSKL
jgi:phosphatidylserine/phosphatidylglycerophosphate/cardiolipin synthase-like enzyme